MKAKLSRFPVSSLGSLASDTITISKKPVNSVVANNALLKEVEDTHTKFFAVFGKRSFSGLGSSVEEGDIYRDEPLRGMKSILKGFSKVSDYPYQKDAIALLDIMDQLGGDIENQDYGSENESLEKLIVEYDKPENTVRLKNLSLTELYSTLKTRHTGFMDLYFQQTDSNAALRRQGSASQLHNALAESLRNYFGLVNAMRNVPGWQALYSELDEVIKAANNKLSDPDKDKPASPTT